MPLSGRGSSSFSFSVWANPGDPPKKEIRIRMERIKTVRGLILPRCICNLLLALLRFNQDIFLTVWQKSTCAGLPAVRRRSNQIIRNQ
jgi:hypothetical protein